MFMIPVLPTMLFADHSNLCPILDSAYWVCDPVPLPEPLLKPFMLHMHPVCAGISDRTLHQNMDEADAMHLGDLLRRSRSCDQERCLKEMAILVQQLSPPHYSPTWSQHHTSSHAANNHQIQQVHQRSCSVSRFLSAVPVLLCCWRGIIWTCQNHLESRRWHPEVGHHGLTEQWWVSCKLWTVYHVVLMSVWSCSWEEGSQWMSAVCMLSKSAH